MRLAQPLFPARAGYHWVLKQNVEIFNGTGSPSNINLPPTWNADGTLYISNFEGRTTFTNGANYSFLGADDYELGRWIYAQIDVYSDGVKYGTMAVSPDEEGVSVPSGSTYININGDQAFREYAAPPATWPEQITITYQAHSHDSVAGSLAVELIKWVGDVWVSVPGDDAPAGEPGTDCPPGCTSNSGVGGGSLTPEQQADLAAALEVTWPRTNARVDPTALDLGLTGELTYADEWDGPLPFFLDGFRLTVTAQPGGGYAQRAEYRFTKFPGTDAVGLPFWFTTNVHATGDVVHRTKP